MTIQDAIDMLTRFRVEHGNTELVLDCPSCGRPFVPIGPLAVAARASGRPSTEPVARRPEPRWDDRDLLCC